ncbi:MAG: glycosyltransferase [Bacteroidetes bacterium]|jgi:glycosyltransferase involved in cell wall biosynthesis|nr:glycosyltransferase [Bacteroidota bacterium]
MEIYYQNILRDPNQFLLTLFTLFAFFQLLYYFFLYTRLAFKKISNDLPNNFPPISVIICAKNEAENLGLHLPKVLTQDYPDFEVIVVDDCSEDETDMVLADHKKQFSHLKITSISPDRKFTHGKKLAITVGIKAATHEWLVFTDADCYPLSDQWLRYLARNFDEKTQIVLGYSGFQPRATLLNNYIRFDAFFIALQYLSYALNRNPYMGVGRNLAYRKSLFFKHKGFAKHYHILSGDDDLFVNENATKDNTKVEIHPKSFTRSEMKPTFREFFKQKMRHFSTYKLYKPKHKYLLVTELLTRLGFYGCFVYLMTMNLFVYEVLIIFSIRFFIQFIIFTTSQMKLKEKHIWPTSPIFDVISLFINFGIDLNKRLRTGRGQWQ